MEKQVFHGKMFFLKLPLSTGTKTEIQTNGARQKVWR